MTEHERALELARKLHALSQRGVYGEKVNAEVALKRLLKRHGIEEWELVGETQRVFQFSYRKMEQRFVWQVICNVIGKRRDVRYNSHERYFSVKLTAAEHVEVSIKLDHYWQLLKEERELFYSAFIQANKLYTKSDPDEVKDAEPPTPEELERLKRMYDMMRGIRTITPARRLERGEKLNS